jgi:hypothetical protein
LKVGKECVKGGLWEQSSAHTLCYLSRSHTVIISDILRERERMYNTYRSTQHVFCIPLLLWSMIHWECVGVQVSHTVSSVSHSIDTVVINDSLRVGWGTSLPHHVFCIPFNGYCCDQWFIESGLGYKSPTPCLLYPIQ